MSLQSCQPTAYSGFPVLPPLTAAGSAPINSILTNDYSINTKGEAFCSIVPIDITASWQPTMPSVDVSIYASKHSSTNLINPFVFTLPESTSLTSIQYGTATYDLYPSIAIVQNQHARLTGSQSSKYEMIITFYKKDNSNLYSSSPNILLLCRPLTVSSEKTTDLIWTPIANALARATRTARRGEGVAATIGFNIESIYTFPTTKSFMPMVAYSTCLPVKVLNSSILNPETTAKSGSISMRVYVVNQPLVINTTTEMEALIPPSYSLSVPISRLFLQNDVPSGYDRLQFKNGLGTGGFPSDTAANLLPLPYTVSVSGTISNTIRIAYEYVVPDELLGMSITTIAALTDNTKSSASGKSVSPRNTQFKCYQIDPSKDISNGTITIDPKTGLPLNDLMAQRSYNDNGGDPSLTLDMNASSGLMPGDWQQIGVIALIVVVTIFLLVYLLFILDHIIEHRSIQNVLIHCALMALIFGLLIGIGVMYGKEKK